MAKLGMNRTSKAVIQYNIEGNPAVVTNPYLGAKAFRIDDAATKLITMIGSGFFSEPKYYDNDSYGQSVFVPELACKGQVALNPKHKSGLTTQAQSVIETAIAVANSDNPQDLWVICQWAREELHVRSTPNVLAAVACSNNATKPWARHFVSKIAQRADEPLQVFAAYMHLFGEPLPNSLSKALSDTLSKMSEWELLRYAQYEGHPNTKDMILMSYRKAGYPLSKELFEYIVNGVVINPEKTPIAAALKALAQCKDFNDEAKELIRKSRATWEVVISQFGPKPEVWEFLVQNNLLGYMALLRNLRNLEQVGISKEAQKLVREKLINGVASSKQLPFRFMSARNNTSANWTASAIDLAMDEACKNIPEIPGRTCMLVDVSGSMDSRVSEKSQMSHREAAAALSAMLAKKYGSENVEIIVFGDSFKRVGYSDADSVMNIAKAVRNTGVGHATYAYKPVVDMTKKGDRFDRIVLFSDMQCYGEAGSRRSYFNDPGLSKAFEEYKNKVNHNVFLHSIDMAGYGSSQFDPKDKHVQLLGGFSENLFNLFRSFEGVETGVQIPTIDELRARYGTK